MIKLYTKVKVINNESYCLNRIGVVIKYKDNKTEEFPNYVQFSTHILDGEYFNDDELEIIKDTFAPNVE